jgi:hypothetical protein
MPATGSAIGRRKLVFKVLPRGLIDLINNAIIRLVINKSGIHTATNFAVFATASLKALLFITEI